MPAWGRPQTARCISMYTNPFSAWVCKLYCCIVNAGKSASGFFIYLYLSNGTERQTFLISRLMYLAPSVLRTLLHIHFEMVRSAVHVESLPGLWIKFLPAVIRILCVSVFWGQKLTTTWAYVMVWFLEMCGISVWVMTNMAFVPFWPVFTSPCAIPPKSFSNAVCHISLIAGSCISFL